MRKSFIVQHLATRGLSRGDEQELGLYEWTNRWFLGEQSADIFRCCGSRTVYRIASEPTRATCHVWHQHIHLQTWTSWAWRDLAIPTRVWVTLEDDEMRQVHCPAVSKVVLCGEQKYLRGSSQQCET